MFLAGAHKVWLPQAGDLS